MIWWHCCPRNMPLNTFRPRQVGSDVWLLPCLTHSIKTLTAVLEFYNTLCHVILYFIISYDMIVLISLILRESCVWIGQFSFINHHIMYQLLAVYQEGVHTSEWVEIIVTSVSCHYHISWTSWHETYAAWHEQRKTCVQNIIVSWVTYLQVYCYCCWRSNTTNNGGCKFKKKCEWLLDCVLRFGWINQTNLTAHRKTWKSIESNRWQWSSDLETQKPSTVTFLYANCFQTNDNKT